MITYETVRFEITEHYLRDGVAGSDTITLYPPIDKYWQDRDVRKVIDKNGTIVNFVPTGYECITIAGFFKYTAANNPPPTSKDTDLCKKRWGESPYKHVCYEEIGKSICQFGYTGFSIITPDIDTVNCVPCLRVLAKRNNQSSAAE